jgi:ERCC4-type nuclease
VDLLRALPGVSEANYHQLAAKVLCLQDLFVMSLAALQAIIGAENGRKLHTFINTQASSAHLSAVAMQQIVSCSFRLQHRCEAGLPMFE